MTPSTTRAQLLTEAEKLVRRQGYAGFSYADLADAVGLRKASIHHHFPTKEHLGVALVAAYDARYDAAMAEIVRTSPTGADRVEAYARLYLQGLDDNLGCLCAALAIEISTLPPAFRGALSGFFDKHVGWLEAALDAGLADGSVRAGIVSKTHARLIVSTLEGALLMERVLGGAEGFNGTLQALRATLKR